MPALVLVLVAAVLLAFFYPAYSSFLPFNFPIDEIEAGTLSAFLLVVGGIYVVTARPRARNLTNDSAAETQTAKGPPN